MVPSPGVGGGHPLTPPPCAGRCAPRSIGGLWASDVHVPQPRPQPARPPPAWGGPTRTARARWGRALVEREGVPRPEARSLLQVRPLLPHPLHILQWVLHSHQGGEFNAGGSPAPGHAQWPLLLVSGPGPGGRAGAPSEPGSKNVPWAPASPSV